MEQSNSEWWAHTCWAYLTMTAEDVSAALGLRPSSLKQFLRRNRDVFPAPINRGEHEHRWSSREVYRYICRYRRKDIWRVPRLFPQIDGPGPARFLGTSAIDTPSGRTGVHYWQPSDDGPPVAIVYPTTASRHWPPGERSLLQRVRSDHPRVSTVFYPTVQIASTRTVAVVQPRIRFESDNGTDKDLFNVELGWMDLANLLRVDVPLWEVDVARPESVQAWRPGAAVQRIRPRDTFHDPDAIERLSLALDEPAAGVVRTLSGVAAKLFAYGGDVFDMPFGFVRGAVAEVPEVDSPSEADLSIALHAVVPPIGSALLGAAYSTFVAAGSFRPVIEDLYEVIGVDLPLGRRWKQRLQPVDEDATNTLGWGFTKLRADVSPAKQPKYWADPKFSDMWIIELDGTYLVTMPQRWPTAAGRLERVELAQSVHSSVFGFWEDSDGDAWPLPEPDRFRLGPSAGSGPRALAATILLLADDATATAYGWNHPDESSFQALVDLFESDDWPRALVRDTDGIVPTKMDDR